MINFQFCNFFLRTSKLSRKGSLDPLQQSNQPNENTKPAAPSTRPPGRKISPARRAAGRAAGWERFLGNTTASSTATSSANILNTANTNSNIKAVNNDILKTGYTNSHQQSGNMNNLQVGNTDNLKTGHINNLQSANMRNLQSDNNDYNSNMSQSINNISNGYLNKNNTRVGKLWSGEGNHRNENQMESSENSRRKVLYLILSEAKHGFIICLEVQ